MNHMPKVSCACTPESPCMLHLDLDRHILSRAIQADPAMPTEDRTAMIDAIYAGEEFSHDWPGDTIKGSDLLRIRTYPDKFILTSKGILTAHIITGEQEAREVAAALMAWANRKRDIRLQPQSETGETSVLDAFPNLEKVEDGVYFVHKDSPL